MFIAKTQLMTQTAPFAEGWSFFTPNIPNTWTFQVSTVAET